MNNSCLHPNLHPGPSILRLLCNFHTYVMMGGHRLRSAFGTLSDMVFFGSVICFFCPFITSANRAPELLASRSRRLGKVIPISVSHCIGFYSQSTSRDHPTWSWTLIFGLTCQNGIPTITKRNYGPWHLSWYRYINAVLFASGGSLPVNENLWPYSAAPIHVVGHVAGISWIEFDEPDNYCHNLVFALIGWTGHRLGVGYILSIALTQTPAINVRSIFGLLNVWYSKELCCRYDRIPWDPTRTQCFMTMIFVKRQYLPLMHQNRSSYSGSLEKISMPGHNGSIANTAHPDIRQ